MPTENLVNKIKEVKQNSDFYNKMKENKTYREMFIRIYLSEFPNDKVTDEQLITLL